MLDIVDRVAIMCALADREGCDSVTVPVADVQAVITEIDHARRGLALASDEYVAEVERAEKLRVALRGIYGTVSVKPTWERRWPHVNALVREALGLE